MIIYQCKMCGGNLSIEEGSKVTTCEYCRTQQTVPDTDEEKIATLYNRANRFRRNSEYDKAMGIYEHILAENAHDAEAYWSLVLCKYGIEYVEDPSAHQQIPTINRTQSVSVMQDADYLMALEYADFAQKQIYESEAKKIDDIQKEILRIANNEAPYDIFISYKEKAPNGERTKSSVLAHDIYRHLTKEGYRVFFSRVSLEDKVGQKYEPYIYSALNSARVMLVVSTEKDEIMSPWVRNEWSRYLAMMRDDTNKLLIPCYRDLDIVDLPNEFQILQAQDMSKVGFEQDLLHGIEKLVANKGGKVERITSSVGDEQSLDRLLQNAETYMKLEDYVTAGEVYKKVTKLYPENYKGWWGLIQAATGNFTVTEYKKLDKNVLNKWFRYIKKLAPIADYEKNLIQYISFWREVSKSQVEVEKNVVEYIVKQYNIQVQTLNEELELIDDKEEELQNDFYKRDEQLQSIIGRYEEEYTDLLAEAKAIIDNGIAAVIITLLLTLIAIVFAIIKTSVAFGIIMVCAISAVSLYFFSNHLDDIGSVSEKRKQARERIILLNGLDKDREKAQKDFEEILEKLENERTPIIESIEKIYEKIDECYQYMENDEDILTELLFALTCAEIGVDKEMDLDLLKLRNIVLANKSEILTNM